jgi:hypothetical protein
MVKMGFPVVLVMDLIYKLCLLTWNGLKVLMFFLKVIGLYDWSGNNSILPELWIVPHFLPIHPGTLPAT